MPQVKIKETDLTTAPLGEYRNFAVVVPGPIDSALTVDPFNADGICEFRTQADFIAKIGKPSPITDGGVSPVEAEANSGENTSESNEGESSAVTTNRKQIGAQIAYELLGMGYPVIYKKIEKIDDMADKTFWEPLKDKATYDFRFIITGLLGDPKQAISNQIINAVHHADSDDDSTTLEIDKGRGDAIALVDIDENIYNTSDNRADRKSLLEAISKAANSINQSKYAAVFAPTVCLLGTDTKAFENNKFPASFYFLACFKYALDHGFAEWYATAGYTRGVCKYNVESADVNFGEYLINSLEPRVKPTSAEEGAVNLDKSVNVIAKIRGNFYLWGNRTAEGLGEELIASHFLNIRQLCCTLKKQIYVACRRFTFDPNSDVLWINFCNALRPTLEGMKADQGIKDYKIVKLYTAKKAELKARVRIIPIEAVEDFDIEITLEDNFGETSATAVER